MKTRKILIAILVTGLWINISETIRWIFLIQEYWLEHYETMNITLPNEPINGVVWMIWGFLYAILIFILSAKFNLLQTTLLAWSAAFVLMWIVVWNVGVLPTGMLWYNVPLSLIEAFIAVWICKKLVGKQNT